MSIATVAKDVGTTVTGIQTAITFYTLVMASLMITGGKLGQILGRKRAFAIGCVIYGCGSLTTALAGNLAVLIVRWSVLEGAGAALILPAIVALVASNFAADQRPRAYGLVASAGAVAAGPLIGGLLTTYASRRWVFAGEVVQGLMLIPLLIGGYMSSTLLMAATGKAAGRWRPPSSPGSPRGPGRRPDRVLLAAGVPQQQVLDRVAHLLADHCRGRLRGRSPAETDRSRGQAADGHRDDLARQPLLRWGDRGAVPAHVLAAPRPVPATPQRLHPAPPHDLLQRPRHHRSADRRAHLSRRRRGDPRRARLVPLRAPGARRRHRGRGHGRPYRSYAMSTPAAARPDSHPGAADRDGSRSFRSTSANSMPARSAKNCRGSGVALLGVQPGLLYRSACRGAADELRDCSQSRILPSWNGLFVPRSWFAIRLDRRKCASELQIFRAAYRNRTDDLRITRRMRGVH